VNWSRFTLATLAVFVVSTLLNFVIHGVLLKPAYMNSEDLMRTPADSQAHAVFLLVGILFFSIGFVWIYTAGVNPTHWVSQGVHYGVLVWLVASVSRYFIYYAIQPWPFQVVLEQIGLELIMSLILGVLVAAIYRVKVARA
jgi:predicted acyltransferase